MFSHAEYQTLHEGAGLLDRSARGRLQLTGADRRPYLHGLLTNDILALSSGSGCYAALLTPQGRMISDMRVSELGEWTLVDVTAGAADTVRKHFEDFIFSEDVTVSDIRAAWVQHGVYGPRAAEVLARVLTFEGEPGDVLNHQARLSAMPLDHNAQCRFGPAPLVVVSSDDYGIAGFELFTDAGVSADLERELRAAGARDVSAAATDVTRVEAGRPEFGIDMDDHTIPLEAGIEGRAISLTKGCYVGQEIIIRVLHRGQGRVARRLVGLMGEAGGTLASGDRVMAGDREVGHLTSAVFSPRLDRPIALGYVHRDHTAPGSILTLRGGGSLVVKATPFRAATGE